MEARTLVAIEIASSKIKGAVAETAADGRMNVIAVEELHTVDSVRHGRVQNIREVSAAVNEIIRKLENNPAVAPRKVQSVVLSLGGRSLAGTPASATLQFPHEIEVTDQTVNRLMSEAAKDFVGSKNIEAIMARNYYVNNVLVKPVVGTVGTSLRGDFLMLTCSRETRQNLMRLKFDSIRAGEVDLVLRATAIAEAVLTDDDRQLGCALVDFGAETTTVSVYKGGTLAFMSTLPMGSRLITMDLMAGLTLTEAQAEDFKLTLGNLGDIPDTAANATEVNNYVRARAGEIAANIVNQIEASGISAENLGAGIILTGGGAKLPGFGTMLSQQSRMTLRHGALPLFVRFADSSQATPDNIDVVSLLAAARNKADFEGLTPAPQAIEPEPEEEIAIFTTPDKIDDDEAEDRAARIAATADDEPRRAERRPERRTVYEDDEDLMIDDDDDDEAFSRRRRRNEQMRREEQPKRRPFIPDIDDEDEADDDAPAEGGDSIKEANGLLERLKHGIANFFNTGEDEEDDD